MQIDIRLAVWNANGLSSRRHEVELFLISNKIDILLISETHLTSKSYFNIKGYTLINTNHPDDSAHGGSAILIKSNIKFKSLSNIQEKSLQSTLISINYEHQPLIVGSVYFPPRYNLKQDDFQRFFSRLGSRFLIGGDYNSKHPWWGSRITNPKGKELYKCIQNSNYSVLSTGNPTYWPSDPQKIPDLLDFVVYYGISRNHLDVLECYDLSSDHSPILVTYSSSLCKHNRAHLFTKQTDVESYKYWIEKNVNLKIPLKTGADIDTCVEYFTNLLHEATFLSNKENLNTQNGNMIKLSTEIKTLISKKRKLRKIWQRTKYPEDKANWNKATKELTKLMQDLKNKSVSTYLQNLKPNCSDDYSLWKATKYIKHPKKRNPPLRDENKTWLQSDEAKVSGFADFLEKQFQPFLFNRGTPYERDILDFVNSTCQMDMPIKFVKTNEIFEEICNLNSKKAPGYDEITALMLKHLPKKGIILLTYIFNAILRLSHFPSQWKCASIIMIPKPSKPETEISSYRPISLLSTFSKIFERIFIKRMIPLIDEKQIIPEHQFGFRHKHGTPEQCHRIVNYITESLENKKYCSAVFLDIQQAFDRVWHTGLLFKLKSFLPTPFYLLLQSYLSDRLFYVKHNNDYSNIRSISAGVPQGSVLGPILYTIFTADLPTSEKVLVATYADDTAIMAASTIPSQASNIIQDQLNKLHDWLQKWNIKINCNKSKHITFTNNKGDCPPVRMNGEIIPHVESVKYLGLILDRRLNWKSHIKAKRKELDTKCRKLYWLLRPKSQLSVENKLIIYKTLLKPIWVYGIHLWGTTCHSNVNILQRFQSKTLRQILNSQWYVRNDIIHNDLQMPYVKDEINRFSEKYLTRLSNHPNVLAICLLDDSNETRRLKRLHVLDLPFR